MLLEAVEPEGLVGAEHFSIRAKLCVSVFGRPLRHIGVKALAVLHHGREQRQVAAPLQLRQQVGA